MTRKMRLIATLAALTTGCGTTPNDAAPRVQTVPQVDLARYVGTWHEVAHFPMFFQRRCIGDTTAEYARLQDGRISVRNRCRTETGFDEANGKASVVERSGNSKLRVSFFWPFHGDYWIIGLDPDYRWAVIGDPNRKYLWILSRTPTLEKDGLDAALAAARGQDYDLTRLRFTAKAHAATR